MNDYKACLKDTQLLAKALSSVQMSLKEKSDLGQLYADKSGVQVKRDKGNRVRGETVYSCSKIGAGLTAHFRIGPMDKMMWVGRLAIKDGTERWSMRPEVRAAIKTLGRF